MSYIIAKEESIKGKYVFVLHPNIISHLDKIVLDKILKLDSLIELPNFLLAKLKENHSFLNRYYNSKLEEKYLNKLMSSYSRVKVIFMALDNQILLASRRDLYNAHCQGSGIFFRPLAAPIRSDRPLKDRSLGMLKKFLKLFLVYWLSKNSSIKKVFVSEDTEVINWLNRHIKSGLFHYLPDPVKKLKIEGRVNWRNRHSISIYEPVFLVFGSMDTRKNLVNIIRAFGLFKDKKNQKNGTLLILGSFVMPEYKIIVEKTINTYCNHCFTSIIIDDRFVEDDEMGQVFSECQIVVMPYLDFHGSSGVLSRAAEYKKAVITSDEGLVAQLVNKYKLGHTVDPKNIQQISLLMEKSLSHFVDETLRANFLANKDPYLFSNTLLNDDSH